GLWLLEHDILINAVVVRQGVGVGEDEVENGIHLDFTVFIEGEMGDKKVSNFSNLASHSNFVWVFKDGETGEGKRGIPWRTEDDHKYELAKECADDDDAKTAICELRNEVVEELRMHDSFVEGAEGDEDKGLGVFRVRKREQNLAGELEEGDSKKFMLFGMDIELGSVFRSSDVRNKYKDSLLLPKWKAFQIVIYIEEDEGLKDSDKIIAFDYDGCLVNTSSEGDGPDAWSLMYPSIPAKLKGLCNNGYKMVLVACGVDKVESNIEDSNRKPELQYRPFQILVVCRVDKAESNTEDCNRKPELGMLSLMTQDFNFKISVDMKQSFYVGSTAGRETDVSVM
ncbi:hypothetical protein GIB67_002342, partial [Kingdonia uniflora]